MVRSVISLSTIKDALLYTFSSEAELVKEISKLSENFTSNRERLQNYLSDKKMISAYSCFYLLTNIPKLESSLKKMNLNLSEYKSFEFFDIGAGPGTFSWALLNIDPQFKIRAIEKSSYMIEQGNKFRESLFPQADFKYITLKEASSKTSKRIGVFGHSINEMGAESAIEYINKLDLDIVVLIEPGTRDFFKEFLKLREGLKEKYLIKYPCYSSAACPLNSDDWCHQYLRVKHNPEVERLTQLAHKDRRNLPISLGFFEKRNDVNILKRKEAALITRVYPPTKFSLEWQICRLINGANQIDEVQIMLRSYSKKEIKELKLINAGSEVQIITEKVLENRKIRGKILWP